MQYGNQSCLGLNKMQHTMELSVIELGMSLWSFQEPGGVQSISSLSDALMGKIGVGKGHLLKGGD